MLTSNQQPPAGKLSRRSHQSRIARIVALDRATTRPVAGDRAPGDRALDDRTVHQPRLTWRLTPHGLRMGWE